MDIQKKLLELIMNHTGSSHDPLPDHNSDTQLAYEFAQFFITKIDTFRENLQT